MKPNWLLLGLVLVSSIASVCPDVCDEVATDTEQQPTDTLQRDKRNYEQSLDETDKITQVAAARIGEGNSDTASDTNGVEVETEGGTCAGTPAGTLAQLLESGNMDAVLKSLLSPVSPNDFKKYILERTPRHWKRETDDYYSGLVGEFTVEDPEALRAFITACVSVNVNNVDPNAKVGGPLRAMEDITFAKDGNIVAMKNERWPELHRIDLENQLEDNVSVVLNGMQHRSKGVVTLALLLEAALGLQVSVNMYHTPVAGQAFSLHYDATEVIVLQLAGKKKWTVAEPVVHLPRTADVHVNKTLLPHDSPTVTMEVLLEPGDMLYLPRGTLHFATNEVSDNEAAAEPSTHLTIAVAVQFWQTIEAALHVLLMRSWRPGMAPKSTSVYLKDALDSEVGMARNPESDGVYGLPASYMIHAAIRNAGNEASGELRRAALVGGKGNMTAAKAALDALCKAQPNVGPVINGMLRWDPTMDEASHSGLGSIISVVRDLNELKPGADSSSASKWQNLVFTYDLAVDIATGKIDRKFALSSRQVQESEGTLAEAWAAFCEATSAVEPKKLWKPVFKH